MNRHIVYTIGGAASLSPERQLREPESHWYEVRLDCRL
jgi:hypothetical protein